MKFLKQFLLIIALAIFNVYPSNAQSVAINTTASTAHNSAILDVSSTTKGVLIPRLTTLQRTTITTAATGLLVFDTDTNGFWYYSGTGWVNIQATPGWQLSGNSNVPNGSFLGTTNAIPLEFKTNNTTAGFIGTSAPAKLSFGYQALVSNTSSADYNTAFGNYALTNNSIGSANTAIGNNTLVDNTSGSFNTAVGYNSLLANTTGIYNAALGVGALKSSTTGNFNTAIGASALYTNTTGENNVALGVNSLYYNTTGNKNTAIGNAVMVKNTTGISNTASGFSALSENTTGSYNTAVGIDALFNNTLANYNTAIGGAALVHNTIGSSNTAVGYGALFNNTTSSENTAIGVNALSNNTTGNYNVATGNNAMLSNTKGNYNVANGRNALYSNTTGNYNVANGLSALLNNTTGQGNVATGNFALSGNTTGDYNVANGLSALVDNTTGNNNVATGVDALWHNTTGNNNVATGAFALFNNKTGNSNVAIGNSAGVPLGFTNVSNTITIGDNALTGTDGAALIGNTAATFIGGYKNWSNYSDGRFKTNVKENVVGLNFIKQLRPVTYTVDIHNLNKFIYKDKTEEYEKAMAQGIAEKEKKVETGFIAQEVEAAAQKVGYNFDGVNIPKDPTQTHYSISYASFVVPLVKAVQEQQVQIEVLKKENAEIKALIKKILEK